MERCDDEHRASLADLDMTCSFAVVGIKGDWAEFCSTFGFANWATLLSPCLLCHIVKKHMYDLTKFSVLENFMSLPVPAFDPSAAVSRSTLYLPVRNLYEAVHKEVTDDEGLLTKLQELVDEARLPSVYTEHPVAVASEFRALPVLIYIDGVPTTKHDGVIGIWGCVLFSKKRHLLAVIRKSRMCRCGCR